MRSTTTSNKRRNVWPLESRAERWAILAAVALALLSGCTHPPGRVPPVAEIPPPLTEGMPSASQPDAVVALQRIPDSTLRYPRTFGGVPLTEETGVKHLVNDGYEAGYSEERKNPLWAAYYCGPTVTFTPGPRPTRFQVDARTVARVRHEDYSQPDYNSSPAAFDRGHMAPNYAIASRYGRRAQLQTFLMSNIAPQRKNLNQQTWAALEMHIASKYARDFAGVWVICGPVFPETRGHRLNAVAEIPEAFYCIVIDVNEEVPRVLALTMDQSVRGQQTLSRFVVTVDELEERTGLDFFPELEATFQEGLESAGPDAAWEIERILAPSSE